MTPIEKIKSELDIMAAAQRLGLDLDIRNGKASCNCPSCGDTGRHLTLYESSNRFYCFKCQIKGDQIDLYCLFTGKSHKEAIAELSPAGLHHTQPKTQTGHKQPITEARKDKPDEKDYSDLYYETIASTGITKAGIEYLSSRGITKALVEKHGIVSIDDPKQFAAQLRAKASADDLYEAGLFDYSKNGKLYCSFFMPAILFPHWAPDSTRIAYLSTRNLSGDSKSFKLHNRQGQPAYGGGTVDSKEVFIFEGIIDGLSYEAITRKDNWIALCGLITPAAYEALKIQMPNQKLILGLDPDEAGKQALSRIHSCTYINWAAFALELGFKGLQFHPNGKAWDINDYLTNQTRGK